MSHVDRILEEVGWIAARREVAETLARHGFVPADDWLDVLTRVVIEVADYGGLPVERVAEGIAAAERIWWP